MNKYEFPKLKKKLKCHLDKERYEHTLGVMYTCAALAMCYGIDIEQAQAAGLLHDCAKCIPDDKKLVVEMYEKQGGRHQSFEVVNEDLVHAETINELKVR